MTSDLSSCAYDGHACLFVFDVAVFDSVLDGDCGVFGVTEAIVEGSDYVTSYGLVQDHAFDLTTGGTVTDSFLVYWSDYGGASGTYVGWYAVPGSLYGRYYGLSDTEFVGGTLNYTAFFAYYNYYY